MNILHAFFSNWIQPLHLWAITMSIYPGPSCPDHPFSEELDDAEVNTRIHMVLAHGASPRPLEGRGQQL
jgi:hypothetical protein